MLRRWTYKLDGRSVLKKSGLKIDRYLPALILLGGLATHVSWAEEAPSGPNDSGAGANPIDTRITVQASGLNKRPKIGGVKTIVRPGALGRAGEAVPALNAIGTVGRNAIGVPVTNGAGAQGPNVFVPQSNPHAQISQPGSSVVRRESSHPSQITSATAATISGTGVTHPGYGPSAVGGPSKPGAGTISGTRGPTQAQSR